MLEGTVIFGNDGTMRLQSNARVPVAVPVVALQEMMSLTATSTFLRLLNRPAIIEEGSTVGTFLLCLSPWQDLVTDLTDRNVGSYIAEVRKPSAVTEDGFDRVEIRRCSMLNRELECLYHEDMDLDEWLAELNDPTRKPKWTDRYSLHHSINISGYTADDPANYAVDSVGFSTLKHTPLVYNPTSRIAFHKASRDVDPILVNHNAPGVEQLTDTIYSVQLAYEPGEEALTVSELIDTVVCHGLWFETPQGAEATHKLTSEMVERLNHDTQRGEEEAPSTEEDRPMTIEIAPGAFDSIVAAADRERYEWDNVMELLKKTDVTVRIGKTNSDVVSDDRMYGLIIESKQH